MDEKKTENEEQRKYYRIEYPASMRPTIKITKNEFEVVDISEKGVRFSVDEEMIFGRWVSAEVTFCDGETVTIEGRIVRKHENNIGMLLSIKAIPYSKILSEQRYLARFNPGDNSSGE